MEGCGKEWNGEGARVQVQLEWVSPGGCGRQYFRSNRMERGNINEAVEEKSTDQI